MARTGPKNDADVRQLFSTLQARLHSASSKRSHAASIIDVGPNQCRFIVDDGVMPALCCGGRTPLGSSWCADHLRIVFTPEGLRSHQGRVRVRHG